MNTKNQEYFKQLLDREITREQFFKKYRPRYILPTVQSTCKTIILSLWHDFITKLNNILKKLKKKQEHT